MYTRMAVEGVGLFLLIWFLCQIFGMLWEG